MRTGDEGRAAYETLTYDRYVDQRTTRYAIGKPSGSRADVRAKGVWKDGYWTLEFSRKLVTGYPDDVQFDTSLTYTFGVSCYEIAGKIVNPRLSQPFYGAGEISEINTLRWD